MTDIFGILNVTPDSFSDGGQYLAPSDALCKAKEIINSGASVLDIGAESTRPGCEEISPDEEWSRLANILPDIINLAKKHNVKISIDTRNTATIQKIINLNLAVDFINDVSGCQDIERMKLVASSNIEIVIMHNLGIPANPKIVVPSEQNITETVKLWLSYQIELCIKNGIKKEKIIIDPGIGFGKTAQQSLELLKNIDEFKELGCRILVGHSRKSFFSIFTEKPSSQRDIETYIMSAFLAVHNIDFLRVHDVEGSLRAIKVAKGVF